MPPSEAELRLASEIFGLSKKEYLALTSAGFECEVEHQAGLRRGLILMTRNMRVHTGTPHDKQIDVTEEVLHLIKSLRA